MYGREQNLNATCATCQNCVNCQIVGSGTTEYCPQPNIIQQKERRVNELTLWNTGKCCLSCKYCFSYNIYNKRINEDMPEDVIKALPDFIDKYVNRNGNIWFFGAEPLMSIPTIKSIYDSVHSRFPEMRFGLTTNGVMLKDEVIAKWLGEHNFGVLISIDGWEESHNLNRVYKDGSPSFQDVLSGLFNARIYINNNPSIRWTVSPDTVKNIYSDFLSLVKLGLTNLAFEAVYEQEWSQENLETLKLNLINIGKHIEYLAFKGTRIQFKPLNDMIDLLNATNPDLWKKRCGLVNIGGTIGVDIDGTLYSCHRFVSEHNPDSEFAVGHITSGINWEKVDQIRGKWQSRRHYSEYGEHKCFTCPLYTSCMGGCIAVNYDMNKDFHIVPKTYCDIQNIYFDALIKPALTLRRLGMKNSGFWRN
jgi:Arylsulfatase regulator (Fe-S oxidoreductase)